MVLALEDHWIWDSWYLRDGDTQFLPTFRDLLIEDLVEWSY